MGEDITLFIDFLNKKLPQADYESDLSEDDRIKAKGHFILSDKKNPTHKSPKKT
jgi:hypothetical protein